MRYGRHSFLRLARSLFLQEHDGAETSNGTRGWHSIRTALGVSPRGRLGKLQSKGAAESAQAQSRSWASAWLMSMHTWR